MDRLFCVCIALLISLGLYAYDFTFKNSQGVSIYYNIVDEQARTCEVAPSGTYYNGELIIPQYAIYKNEVYTVIGIGNNAFDRDHYITGLELPPTITYIGKMAFFNCYGLTKINIPASVNKISDFAFTHTDALKVLVIDDLSSWCSIDFESDVSVPAAQHDIYIKDVLLENLIIPDDISKISQYAFFKSNISSIEIPSSVVTIGKQAFSYCEKLKSVRIHNSIMTMGDATFMYCNNLSDVYIDDLKAWFASKHSGEMGMNDYIFENAQNFYINNERISDLVIPDGVTVISEYSFSGYKGLESIEIPESVQSIERYTFSGCTNLYKVKSHIKVPFDIPQYTFSNMSYATLYVLEGTKDLNVTGTGE